MDDPDQTTPAPRDDGSVPPKRPTSREVREMATGNQRAVPPSRGKPKAIAVDDLNAANDK
jgi:hypothetical protein